MGYWDYDRGIHSPIPYQAPDSLVILDVAPAMIRNDSPRRLSVLRVCVVLPLFCGKLFGKFTSEDPTLLHCSTLAALTV